MPNSKCLIVAVLLLLTCCFGYSQSITINNQSGKPVYVYDWDMSKKPAVTIQPLSKGNPLANKTSLELTMQTVADPSQNTGRRIFVSDQRLKQSLERVKGKGLDPAMPDAFTPWYDGGIMFSFAEYLYQPNNNRYTFDLSYIDTYSYPLTVTFTIPKGTKYEGCVSGFEYGIKSLSSVMQALKKQTKYTWSNLVWPKDNPASPVQANWPKGIYRIIGPNKAWTSNSFGMSGYAPNSYQNFVKQLPFNGKQLFGKKDNNFDGWRYLDTAPQNTGYVKALHSCATPDSTKKYGFFTYCNDNKTGEFTWIPSKIKCEVTIYPYDK